MTMSQFALRWILMFDAVSCAIPGGKRAGQVAENCAAAELPALTEEGMSAIRKIHGQRIPGLVHHRW
jgi:aryl-alcohol dehydrogenase-like predicted oxidoreductase